MNIPTRLMTDSGTGVDIVDDPALLNTFLNPTCPAAIWRRRTPENVQNWIDGLDPEVLPHGRVILSPTAVKDTVSNLSDMSGFPVGPERDWLEADVTSLANMFADLMSTRFLRMRLAVVTTNACRKFHIDAISARLICTYRGIGTQYGLAVNGADPKRVFTVQTGAPFLLRGTLSPAQPASGLVHRSPPIEGSGESRLVLVLDPVYDKEDEI